MTLGSTSPAWSSAGIGSPRIGSHILGSSSSNAHANIRTSVESSLAYLSRPKSGRSTIDRVSKSSHSLRILFRPFVHVNHDLLDIEVSKPFAPDVFTPEASVNIFLKSLAHPHPDVAQQNDREGNPVLDFPRSFLRSVFAHANLEPLEF